MRRRLGPVALFFFASKRKKKKGSGWRFDPKQPVHAPFLNHQILFIDYVSIHARTTFFKSSSGLVRHDIILEGLEGLKVNLPPFPL